MPHAFPMKSVGMMVLAMTLIVIGDAAGKGLTGAGFNPFFIAWSRFALGAVLLFPFCGLTRADLPALLNWRVLLRACLIAAAICSILTALKTEPIANVFGGFFVGPVVAYFLSALILKEHISWRRTLLLGASFVGVLLVVKPGFGMTSGMGFAVLAGCLHGTFLIATRGLAGLYRPRFLLISQLLSGAVILFPFSIGPLPSISLSAVSLVFVSALGSALGNLLLVLVNRTTPANVIAPLIYSQLLAATLIGLLVFSDWPDGFSLIGLIIIMAAGFSSFLLARRGS